MDKQHHKHRYNPKNERMKYKYRVHQKRAFGKDDKTVIAILKHLREYELFTDFAGFETFDDDHAHRYIGYLEACEYSPSYLNDCVRHLREFMRWLERQKGYKSKLDYNHIDYLNLTRNQKNTAKATGYKKAYNFGQIVKAIRAMPAATITEKRNKAMVSLQALCGLRVSELRTVTLNSFIEEDGHYFIYINPKEMQVKFAKPREADLIKLTDDITQNVLDWRNLLIEQGFTKTDPLFPRITCHFSQGDILKMEMTRQGMKSNSSISAVFKKAYTTAGFEYLRVHSFRHTLARAAGKANSPDVLNATSKSLGHSNIDVTVQSYGDLSPYERRQIIANHVFYVDEDG